MEKTISEGKEITIEDLKKTLEEVQGKLKLHKDAFAPVKKEFDDKYKEIECEFSEQMERYFDQVLLDKNGNNVKIGHILEKRKGLWYKVTGRSMQIVFGQIMNNPRVWIKKVNSDGTDKDNAREIDICKSDLTEYTIVS